MEILDIKLGDKVGDSRIRVVARWRGSFTRTFAGLGESEIRVVKGLDESWIRVDGGLGKVLISVGGLWEP